MLIVISTAILMDYCTKGYDIYNARRILQCHMTLTYIQQVKHFC